jgi:hypothetical protein
MKLFNYGRFVINARVNLGVYDKLGSVVIVLMILTAFN